MEVFKDYVFEIIAVIVTILAGGTTFGFVKDLYGKITAQFTNFKESVEITKFKQQAEVIITAARNNNDKIKEIYKKLEELADIKESIKSLDDITEVLSPVKDEIKSCIESNKMLSQQVASLTRELHNGNKETKEQN